MFWRAVKAPNYIASASDSEFLNTRFICLWQTKWLPHQMVLCFSTPVYYIVNKTWRKQNLGSKLFVDHKPLFMMFSVENGTVPYSLMEGLQQPGSAGNLCWPPVGICTLYAGLVLIREGMFHFPITSVRTTFSWIFYR